LKLNRYTWVSATLIGFVVLILACVAVSLMGVRREPRDAPVQASQRPFGLPLYSPVKAAGSDLRAWMFRWFDLPVLIRMADSEFSHASYLSHFEKMKINPARLQLTNESEVRVYFIGEGSGIETALGINLEGMGADEGNPRILFPNVSTRRQLDVAARLAKVLRLFTWMALGGRSPEKPLIPGDFVDLGILPKGSTLNFFLNSPGQGLFNPIPERNPDGAAHMVASAVEGTPFLLISFEDLLGGGDQDYEDAVFAVEISDENVQALLGRHDPWRYAKRMFGRIAMAALVILGPLLFVLLRQYWRSRKVRQALADAERLVQSRKAHEALVTLRKTRELVPRSQMRKWQEMTFSAATQSADIAHLVALENESPELFAEREPESLAVGHAQIETDQLTAYAGLRKVWQDREKTPSAWALLDAGAMAKEGREKDAAKLLENLKCDPAREAVRLARLAAMTVRDDPGKASSLIAKALEAGPRVAEAHILAGMVFEELGKVQEAFAEHGIAMRLAPRDPFARDRMADFCCRHGQYAQGVKLWYEGLRPPSMDFAWTKYLFWTRVAVRMGEVPQGLEPPPGPLEPLAAFMLTLPPERFWDASGFHRVADRHPHLVGRQELHWRRLLEVPRTGCDIESRWLRGFEREGRDSWNPHLETALLRIVLYRLTGSLGPFEVEAAESSFRVQPHPFLAELERQARSSDPDLPAPLLALVKSDFIYAAACLAAGWPEAAVRLYPTEEPPAEAPEWAKPLFRQAWTQAGKNTPA